MASQPELTHPCLLEKSYALASRLLSTLISAKEKAPSGILSPFVVTFNFHFRLHLSY